MPETTTDPHRPLSLDEALARLMADLVAPEAHETLTIDAAAGRVLAAPVHARTAAPPFDNSAMDGWAVIASDPALAKGQPLRETQRIMAGECSDSPLTPGCCARVFTGAPLPPGADAVIAQEDAETQNGSVRFREVPTAGRYVRRAGGDVAAQDRILDRGQRLHAGHLAVAAAAGTGDLRVHRRPRVALITNGDELRPPSATLRPGQIHDSSAVAFPALLAQLPVEFVGAFHSPDDPQALARTFDEASEVADALITTGGVSVGDADHVKAVLAAHGAVGFWRLALKPGRPFAFGRYRTRPLFGLPGNPVSSIVTFLLLVRPALQRLAGQTPETLPRLRAELASAVRKAPGRRDFQRANLARNPHTGALTVAPCDRQDSNVLSVLAQADALIDLPEPQGDLDAGAAVDVIDLRGLLGPR